jgi:hypothetical protein
LVSPFPMLPWIMAAAVDDASINRLVESLIYNMRPRYA